MSPKEFDGSVVFNYHVPLAPLNGDPSQYALKLGGSIIVAADDDDVPDQTIGRIKLMVVKMAQAVRDDVKLFEVFDSHNLDDIHQVLFERDKVFRRELKIAAPLSDLLLIEEIKIKAAFATTGIRNRAVETVIAHFASVGLVVIKKKVLRVSTESWLDSGYLDLLHAGYLLRDNFRLHS